MVLVVLVCWERKAVAVSAADGEDAESARVVVEKREWLSGRAVRMLRRKEAMIAMLCRSLILCVV